MGKHKAPLLSLGASGTIADTLTYQRSRKLNISRTKPIPFDPQSDRQLWHRYLYHEICLYWNTLSAAEKQTWETNARPYKITGFNLFMRTELNYLAHLKLCLPFLAQAGNIAYDYSGNLNHATVFGALWGSDADGDYLDFDGVNDYLDIPISPSLNITENITVEVLFKWLYAASDTFPGLVGKGYWGFANRSWEMYIRKSNQYLAWSASYPTPFWPVPVNTLQHLTITHPKSTGIATLYVNGTLRGTLTTPFVHENRSVSIGATRRRDAGSSFLDGNIYNVMVYDAIVPQASIKMHAERFGL